MIRVSHMCIFTQVVRYTNPNIHIIQPQKYRSTVPVKYCVCALIIYMDTKFSKVVMLMMRLSSTCGDVVLENNMYKWFSFPPFGDYDRGYERVHHTQRWRFLASSLTGSMFICNGNHERESSWPKTIGKTCYPCTFSGRKEGIGGLLIIESWQIQQRNLVLEVPP